MTPRAFIRMLAVSAAVTGSLALWHSPAKAAVTRPSAEPPTGYPVPFPVHSTKGAGRPARASHIPRVPLANDPAQRSPFPPPRPPRSFAENRLIHEKSELEPVPIHYSVRNVVIDGANVVYGGT